MNILLINHYAGSDHLGMEYRPFYLAREWAAAGHRTTIIGASFSHLRTHQPAPGADLAVSEEDGVRFRWLRTRPYQGNGVGRVVNMAGFVSKLYAYADRIAHEERPEVVICSSTYPLDIYPGVRIARKAGARLVFEVHDLWPLSPMLLGGYSPRHPYIAFMQMAEDTAYRVADTVVSILPHTLEHMVGRGMDPRKFAYVPNGVVLPGASTPAPVPLPEPVVACVAAERARGRFLVGYVGGMNPSNAVGKLIDAAERLAGAPVSFLLAGAGSEAEALRARVAALGLDTIHLVGSIPKLSVPDFLKRLDAGVMPWFSSPLHRYGVSHNKMFDYMLAARPVIQANDAPDALATEAGCGVAVPSGDPAAMAEAILALSRRPAAERQGMGENGRRYVLKHHDYRVLAARFLKAVQPACVVPLTAAEAFRAV